MFFQSFFLLLVTLTVGNALREAKDEEFPFQVSIQTGLRRHICGGAIITPKWVLTSSACFKRESSVLVCYGSADSNIPKDCVRSLRVIHQDNFNFLGRSRLSLVELENPLTFSSTVKQARVPMQKAELRNVTKLSGWNVVQSVNLPPNLNVIDRYLIIEKLCKRASGTTLSLSMDEFCGMDEEGENFLFNPGSTVSKAGIVLGILEESPLAASEPCVYAKVSAFEQWIKDVLGSDSEKIDWADSIPKDSAAFQHASVTLIGISAFVLALNKAIY